MKNNKRYIYLCSFLVCSVLLSGCISGVWDDEQKEAQKENMPNQSADMESELPKEIPIEDNDMLYENDKDESVVTMYLTVRQGNAAENTNHTWEEINGHSVYYYEDLGIDRYMTEGILQVGDESGPLKGELGYGVYTPNAIVSVRGQTSSKSSVKSYKIELKDGKGSWREQKTINLNKHVYDGVRFRNKLCYDLMEELPGMISLRTQFVHLYVKDETVEGEAKFVDYGLYTQVEQPNRAFLKNHGLDRYGQLYKINFFEFLRYEDVIKLKSDKDYDEKAFNELLEIKGDDDHSKLIAMLTDLNDYSKPIEEVFEKWFDEENLFSWMAFHILTGNVDTQSRNSIIYSPLNINKWYFISWDNDGALKKTESLLDGKNTQIGWQYGVCNYWGNTLFQRVLKSETYRQKLDAKIEQYKSIMTEEKLTEMIAGYDTVIRPFKSRLPDIESMRLTDAEYQQVCQAIPKEIEQNYQLYKKSLESPMPFFIEEPSYVGNKILYTWQNSYDFDMENVTYSFELAKDYTFAETIVKQEGLVLPEYETGKLAPGQYFIRVISQDESGNRQFAFDDYATDEGNQYGIKCFYVLPDGSIEEDAYEEE